MNEVQILIKLKYMKYISHYVLFNGIYIQLSDYFKIVNFLNDISIEDFLVHLDANKYNL